MEVSWRKHRVILKKKVFLGKKIGTNHGRLKWVGDTLSMDSDECDHIIWAIVIAGNLPFCYYHERTALAEGKNIAKGTTDPGVDCFNQ